MVSVVRASGSRYSGPHRQGGHQATYASQGQHNRGNSHNHHPNIRYQGGAYDTTLGKWKFTNKKGNTFYRTDGTLEKAGKCSVVCVLFKPAATYHYAAECNSKVNNFILTLGEARAAGVMMSM